MNPSRRRFLRRSTLSLAAVGAGALLLKSGVGPTEAADGTHGYTDHFTDEPAPTAPAVPEKFSLTEDNILGPFHRKGAPYRAKITPPLEPGKVLLISGRVWGHDTRKPLAGATIEIWQANAQGRYDNDDADNPPAEGVFVNRARVFTDESGCYEYETIHPGAYKTGPDTWRPSHVHYWVRHAGYKPLVTQLYFNGDKRNAADEFIKQSLIIEVADVKANGASYERGYFDIVLAPA